MLTQLFHLTAKTASESSEFKVVSHTAELGMMTLQIIPRTGSDSHPQANVRPLHAALIQSGMQESNSPRPRPLMRTDSSRPPAVSLRQPPSWSRSLQRRSTIGELLSSAWPEQRRPELPTASSIRRMQNSLKQFD